MVMNTKHERPDWWFEIDDEYIQYSEEELDKFYEQHKATEEEA